MSMRQATDQRRDASILTPSREPLLDERICAGCGAISREPTTLPDETTNARSDAVQIRLQIFGGSRRNIRRFTRVSLLPTVGLAVFVLALASSGAVTGPPDVDRLSAGAARIGFAQVITLALIVGLAALLIHPFQTLFVRLLEGYWPSAPWIARIGLGLQRWRRSRLEQVFADKPRSNRQRQRRIRASEQLASYPSDRRLLPTRLGNVLRAAEDLVGDRYGLDAITFWPRLYPLIPSHFAEDIAETRTQFDATVRLCVTLTLASVLAGVTLLGDGGWTALPIVTAALAVVAYRAAVRIAITYGRGILVAFDLYRFEMLESLHYPLPSTLEEELRLNRQLGEFLRSGRPLDGADAQHRYDHVANGSSSTRIT